MKSEIEAKFLGVDHDKIREKLQTLGAGLEVPMREMRRVVMRTERMRDPIKVDAFIRVRDEGNKITLTYKQMADVSLSGAKEIEVTVSSFEDTLAIFEQAGLVPDSYQESKRETWKLGEVEVVLDEWPWLRPYIEIEGPSEESVQQVASQLGFDWNNAIFGAVTFAYRAEYPNITPTAPINVPEIRFGDPVPWQLTGKKDS